MDIMWDLVEHVKLPKIVKVRQSYDNDRIDDIDASVGDEFSKPEIDILVKAGMKIAVAVGSRGIANIGQIMR